MGRAMRIENCSTWVAGIAVALLVGASLPCAAGTTEGGSRRPANTVSVDFEETAASVAFREIERVTGIVVRAPDSIQARTVTLELHDVAAEAAVRATLRALAVSNYATLYPADADGRAVFVVLPNATTGRPQPVAATRSADMREGGSERAAKSNRELVSAGFVAGSIAEEGARSRSYGASRLIAND